MPLRLSPHVAQVATPGGSGAYAEREEKPLPMKCTQPTPFTTCLHARVRKMSWKLGFVLVLLALAGCGANASTSTSGTQPDQSASSTSQSPFVGLAVPVGSLKGKRLALSICCQS